MGTLVRLLSTLASLFLEPFSDLPRCPSTPSSTPAAEVSDSLRVAEDAESSPSSRRLPCWRRVAEEGFFLLVDFTLPRGDLELSLLSSLDSSLLVCRVRRVHKVKHKV